MTNTTPSSVKKYYNEANQAIDEQAILDKYNAATTAQFNVQREQNRQAENKFYNQMYNTQRTAMDTIRQANANAVSTGASRGVQAANELSALLGLQDESVASATELAQANRQTAQEETAAVLENVLKAYQQAQQEKAQYVQHAIESASVDVQSEANQATAQQAQTDQARLVTEAAENGATTYLTALQNAGINYSDGVITPESTASFNTAISHIYDAEGKPITFTKDDWEGTGVAPHAKAETVYNDLYAIITAYGLDPTKYTPMLNDFKTLASETKVGGSTSEEDDALWEQFGLDNAWGRKDYARYINQAYKHIVNQITNDYMNGLNRKTK